MTKRKAEAPEADPEKDTLLVGVGKRVRELRTGLRMTQIQAADACDVPQTLIFSTEAGLQNLTLRTLGKLAKGLNTNVRDLMPVTPAAMEQERPPPQTLAEVIEKLDRVTQEAARLSQLASFLLAQSQQATQRSASDGDSDSSH
ncbi:helix-turn-helix domain-containing protein [Roseomonas mucosa]|uniref:helix-turn-helix domain-containing protein n=1 Tax=Roseomonas mucosa TaxID=207340 RepID=UPI0028CCB8AA|nr:helix-turn-helix transcriptional regulator [Roseomonas mucosa]MDT8350996.1 helix-turn-helix transcriptional regulator [Roseomonas mucosa]